jgi:hypothetical protein
MRDPSEVRRLDLCGAEHGKQANQDRQHAGSKIGHRVLSSTLINVTSAPSH